jgi:hypothetical protein
MRSSIAGLAGPSGGFVPPCKDGFKSLIEIRKGCPLSAQLDHRWAPIHYRWCGQRLYFSAEWV